MATASKSIDRAASAIDPKARSAGSCADSTAAARCSGTTSTTPTRSPLSVQFLSMGELCPVDLRVSAVPTCTIRNVRSVILDPFPHRILDIEPSWKENAH